MAKSISRKRTQRSETLGTWWDRVSTIGIDLSDRSSQCCAIDDEAAIVAEFLWRCRTKNDCHRDRCALAVGEPVTRIAWP